MDKKNYRKVVKICEKGRYKAKRDIQEGIQEYESRDNLSCSSCIFYDKGFCEKGLLMTENCPEYWD